jgi:protein-S-isoprenylcysteine O-methyltransferase Ste14
MTTLQENERLEYEALMARGRDAEWTSQISWVGCGVAATTLLAWGIATRNPTLMLPVVIATAYGFYAMLRGRQQVRLIAGYVEEFFESHETGARWFTWLGHLRLVPGLQPSNDWFMTSLSVSLVVLAVVFAWLFAGDARRGAGLMPGLITGIAVAFVFHAISETARLHRANFAAFWRQVNAAPADSGHGQMRMVSGVK